MAASLRRVPKRDEDKMLAEWSPLALSVARDFFLPGADRQDVEQEAMAGLLDAIRMWDPEAGLSFKNFAYLVVRRWLQTCIKAANRDKCRLLNEAVTGDRRGEESDLSPVYEMVPAYGADPADVAENREQLAALRRGMASLSPVEREGMRLVVNGLPYKESPQDKRYDNAIQRARRKLREAA